MSTFAESIVSPSEPLLNAVAMNSSTMTWIIIAGILVVFILLAIFLPQNNENQSSNSTGATPSASPSPSPLIVRPTNVVPPHVRRAQLEAKAAKPVLVAPAAAAPLRKTGVQIV